MAVTAARAPAGVNADDVRVFVRAFTTASTGFVYNPNAYPRATEIPALITVELPPTALVGQKYSLTVHQISGGVRRRIIGTFQITVVASRRLAVLKHVGLSIPSGNRWHPIWQRLIRQEEDKIRGLGDRPDLIRLSPHGYDEPTGTPGQPPKPPGTGQEGQVSGRVSRIYYNCFRNIEGFELHTCERTLFVPTCRQAVEHIVCRRAGSTCR